MPTSAILDTIAHVFYARGASQYGGEAVTQLEHALQAAHLAEVQRGSASAIAAALLHDIGHLLHTVADDALEDNIDDVHERLGYQWLRDSFVPSVGEPVKLHVDAKRYLCAVEGGYQLGLSQASLRSLKLQGGPFSPLEAQQFEEHTYFQQSIELRRWDDQAKIPGLRTPPLSHFLQFLPDVMLISVPREAMA
jgi:phosphonate degradation associated HDIG domain protein